MILTDTIDRSLSDIQVCSKSSIKQKTMPMMRSPTVVKIEQAALLHRQEKPDRMIFNEESEKARSYQPLPSEMRGE
jgi:hypothetical protein